MNYGMKVQFVENGQMSNVAPKVTDNCCSLTSNPLLLLSNLLMAQLAVETVALEFVWTGTADHKGSHHRCTEPHFSYAQLDLESENGWTPMLTLDEKRCVEPENFHILHLFSFSLCQVCFMMSF